MLWFQYFYCILVLGGPLVCWYFYTILVLASLNKAFTYLLTLSHEILLNKINRCRELKGKPLIGYLTCSLSEN